MKSKILLFAMTLFLLFVSSSSADRYVNYTFLDGTINTTGNLVPGATPLTDVSVIGFVCASANCSTVSGTLFGGATLNSGSNNSIILTFPTALQSSYGYGIYFFKLGYRTWEQNPNWFGTNATDPQGPFTKYLAKQEVCTAPIDTLTVANDVNAGIPLVIGVNASLDATTYAAIQHGNGTLDYVPPTLQANYYSVNTSVTVTVTNASGTVFSQIQNISIGYSGSQRVEFTWTPQTLGQHTVTATTSVPDAKCLSTQSDTTSKTTTVLSAPPTNTCYTLLQNLTSIPTVPSIGQLVTTTLQKLSNWANVSGVTAPTQTNITFTVTQSGSTVYSNTTTFPANSDNTSYQQIAYFWTPTSSGTYNIIARGIAESPDCAGITNLEETIGDLVIIPSPPTPPQPPGPGPSGGGGGGGGALPMQGINITETIIPSPVYVGNIYDFKISVKNLEFFDKKVNVTFKAFGIASTQEVELKGQTTKTVVFTVLIPKWSAQEIVEFEAVSGSDRLTVKKVIDVIDIAVTTKTEFYPNETQIIFSCFENVPSKNIELFIDGKKVSDLTLDAKGCFNFTIPSDLEAGIHTVRVVFKGTNVYKEWKISVYANITINKISAPRFARVGENISVVADVSVSRPAFVNVSLIVDGKLVEKKIVRASGSEIEMSFVPDSVGIKKLVVVTEVFGGSDEKSRTVFVFGAGITGKLIGIVASPTVAIGIILLGAGALVYYYFYYRKWVARTEPEEFKQIGESKI